MSSAECAAKKSPAIAVTAMRGEVALTIGNRPEINCSGARNVSSTYAAVNDPGALGNLPAPEVFGGQSRHLRPSFQISSAG